MALQALYDKLEELVNTKDALPPKVATSVKALIKSGTDYDTKAVAALKTIMAMPDYPRCSGDAHRVFRQAITLLSG